ncbi:hypothetical protein [Deinococcus peraridilitoris]|uniref:Uncharacterized protein n=1 Tax=Deinococcus peraridilitoris (strain DSM 19664 / LMG 22246 / CIP 109416 / KR-200) TaxID=937777 RepID=L0A701_DEIPD|nr:hypothetical protein [Deinococcus peraridilitoris]AFZ69633.1 hypothetical protein Deipe_4291 [Deinococcus peraridilitoris DSM 19664]
MTKDETQHFASLPYREVPPQVEPPEREFQPPKLRNHLPDGTDTTLRTVGRGEGRMQQPRDQLNVRLPKMLKRLAASQAALEGITVGELIERLLTEYLEDRQD